MLITDDTAFIRDLLKRTLEALDFKVVGEARNGIEAIRKYKELKPDLTLMDVTMPEMNGLDALKEIIRVDAHAVVVMCTAMNQRRILMEAIEAGAFDFIVKPFHHHHIQDMINRVIIDMKSREQDSLNKDGKNLT